MWVEELPNGKYKYIERYTDNYGRSKKVSVTLDKNTNQAQKQATRLLMEKINQKTQQVQTTDLLFWEVAQQVAEREKYTVKPATYRHHRAKESKLRTLIPADTLLVELDRLKLSELLEQIYYKDNYSKSSLISYKAYISAVFEYAIQRGYNITNPTKGLKIASKAETYDQALDKQPKYLELAELQEVITLAENKSHRIRLLIEFLSLTGLRQGECFGLQYQNIQGNQLVISGTYDRYEKEKVTPKTKAGYRTIVLNKRAVDILDEIKSENLAWKLHSGKPTDFLWVNARSGAVIKDSVFSRFLRGLDYPQKQLTSHIFRHTHISLLTELGIPLKVIMERVGHTNPQTTLKIYTHVTQKMSAEVVQRLDTLPL